jgi:hypothetical protein
MQEILTVPSSVGLQTDKTSPWQMIAWLFVGTIALSVVLCMVMAAVRSNGLTEITVTALDQADEPRDLNIPFLAKNQSLPDYEVSLILVGGGKVRLGAKPDTSAVNSLTWQLSDPVSIADVASVRLDEQDKVVSDAVVEVQALSGSTTEKGFRFDFATERSMSVGIKSFFGTPIGQAIVAGFFIAVLMMFVRVFCV